MKTGRRHPRRHRSDENPGGARAPAADYYAVHYRAYHAETFQIDPTPFLEPFARRLRPGSRVLDVGCGSGRDLAWLRRRGFEAIGFERSPGLAELARRETGGEVIVGDFTRFDFASLAVDALLMCGALVHVPHADLPHLIGRILPAVTPLPSPIKDRGRATVDRGPIYISMKEGRGRHVDTHGRIFYLWSDAALRGLFKDLGLAVMHSRRGPSAVEGNRIWLGYVLRID